MRKAFCLALALLLCTGGLAETKINSKNFPDTRFRDYVKTFDTDGNKKLSEEEIRAATVLEPWGLGIADLTGIEYFTALQELYCGDNRLKKLDVSRNTSLYCLSCGGNRLTKLDVSNNPELRYLKCDRNRLKELDLKKNKVLNWLICEYNQLKQLDVYRNHALRRLFCGHNRLKQLIL